MEQVTSQSSVSRSFRALLQRKKQTTHTPGNVDRPHGISHPRKIISPSQVSKKASLVQSMPTPTKAKGRLSTRERRKNHLQPSMITNKRSSEASAEREKKISSTSFQLDSTLSKSAKDTNGNLQQSNKEIRYTLSSSSAPPSTVPQTEEFFEADVSTTSSMGSDLNDISEGAAHLKIESLDEDVQLFCDNEKPMHDSTATPHLSVGGTRSTKTNKLNPHAPEFYPDEASKKKPTATCALPSSVDNTLNTQGGDKQSHTRGTTRVKKSTHEATNSRKAANRTGLARAIRMCSFRKYVDTDLSVRPNIAADKKRQGRKSGQATPVRPRAIRANTIAENYSCPRVTMLDDAFKVFVIDLVPPQICDLILQLTEDHVSNAATLARETWRKLYTYTSLDLPCCEVVTLSGFINQILKDICKIIGDVFRAPKSAARLKPRTWKEPHMLRYQKVKGKASHTGVKLHYDGSHMTWQLMLSDENEYDGE
jgi:hypothetical protein